MLDKVLFLDIDGVLNSDIWNENHQREISDGLLIDTGKVEMLAEVVKRTNAKIVLHSGWKFWFGKDLQPVRKESLRLTELFQKAGISLYDMTSDFTTEEIRRTKKFSLCKANEILDWLQRHQEVDKWVVMDDLDLHHEEIGRHQIKTNPAEGLTEEDVELAIRLLTGKIVVQNVVQNIDNTMDMEYIMFKGV